MLTDSKNYYTEGHPLQYFSKSHHDVRSSNYAELAEDFQVSDTDWQWLLKHTEYTEAELREDSLVLYFQSKLSVAKQGTWNKSNKIVSVQFLQ